MANRTELAPLIAEARRSLVSTLRNLSLEDWEAQSLCGDWAVRDVVGHLIHEYELYRVPYRFFGLIRFGFRVNRYLSMEARRLAAGRPIADLTSALDVAEFEQTRVWKRYQWPVFALSEIVIHTQDIRRPLGIADKPSTAQLKIVAGVFARPPRINPFTRVFMRKLPDTLFEATDTDWSFGHGPTARGPLEAICMVLAGRRQALADLSGEGVEKLRVVLGET